MRIFCVQVIEGTAPIGFLYHDARFDAYYIRTGEFAAFQSRLEARDFKEAAEVDFRRRGLDYRLQLRSFLMESLKTTKEGEKDGTE